MRLTAKWRLAAAAAALTMAAATHAEDAIPGASVASLLEFALANNPEFAAMRHEADAAGARAASAGALMDPKLRVERMEVIELGEQMPHPELVRMNRYRLMQDLPWFGKRDLQRDVAGFERDAAGARARAAWVEVAARIKAAHARLEFVDRNEQLVRQVLDLMARLERVALARYTGGLAPQQDVIRAQLEQTAMANELLMLEKDRRMLQARLNMLLGRAAEAPLAPAQETRPVPAAPELAALFERARANNPLLSADEAKVRAAESNRDLVLRNRYPDFTVGVTSGSLAIGKFEWMVEINIPLQQRSRRAQESESEAMLAAARSRREAGANQVLAELAESHAALDIAQRSAALATNSLLPQAELAFQSALTSYENGRVEFATLLETQRQLRMARQSQLRARTDAQLQLAEIERLLGEEI